MEAMMARLTEINERSHRRDGWRYGAIQETRKQRLRRLEVWDGSFPHWEMKSTVVTRRRYKQYELFVSVYRRPRVPKLFLEDMSLPVPPVEDWPHEDQFNGYCRFKRKLVYERGYHGLLAYTPVHGGITYAHHKMGVSTYGFDTAHLGDDEDPLCKNIEWIEHQAMIMAESVRIAALYERDYLRFKDRYVRVRIIEKYHRHINKVVGQRFNLQNNFGAMINVMFGEI